MRACARCGQEFNPAPNAGTIDWPRTDCNFCLGRSLTPSAFRVLYALDWLGIDRSHSRIDSQKIAMCLGKRHSVVIAALKELAKDGIVARQLPQKDATVCLRCGEEFDPTPKRSGVGRPRTQCNDCKYEKNGRNIDTAPIPKPVIACPQCCKQFVTRDSRKKFCSRSCRRVANYLKQLERNKRALQIERMCLDCGQSCFDPKAIRRRPFCISCRETRRRDSQSRQDHKKRAAGKLPSKAEVVSRWGNRCHLCSKKIDLCLPHNDRRGFTFDHVIPVSLGGTSDPENIRPAHWICNIRRGNRGPVQLDLGMCG
jgi:hypothetical protein